MHRRFADDVLRLVVGDRTPQDEIVYPDVDMHAKLGSDGRYQFTTKAEIRCDADLRAGESMAQSRGAANPFRRSCTDGVSAVANAAWLSLRMIGSGAPRGRKTANQLALQKNPCS